MQPPITAPNSDSSPLPSSRMASRKALAALLVVHVAALLASQTEAFVPIFTHSELQRMQVRTPSAHRPAPTACSPPPSDHHHPVPTTRGPTPSAHRPVPTAMAQVTALLALKRC